MTEDSKKILVIDDDPASIFGTKKMLESRGYDVVEAYDGKDGFEKAHTEKPDLMLIDYTTGSWEYTLFLFADNPENPEKGFSVIDELRKDESTKHIPMLVVSPMDITSSSDFNVGGEWLPSDNILLKPIEKNTLFSRINRLLKVA